MPSIWDDSVRDALHEAYGRIMAVLLPEFRATRDIVPGSAKQEDYDRVAAQLRRAIKTTTLNAFRDHMTRRARVTEGWPEGSESDPRDRVPFGENVASLAPGPAELTIERLLVDHAKRVLVEDLSPRERIVVELHHGIGVDEAYSFARIAGFLAMTEGQRVSKQMVSKIYQRGITKIRRRLGT